MFYEVAKNEEDDEKNMQREVKEAKFVKMKVS